MRTNVNDTNVYRLSNTLMPNKDMLLWAKNGNIMSNKESNDLKGLSVLIKTNSFEGMITNNLEISNGHIIIDKFQKIKITESPYIIWTVNGRGKSTLYFGLTQTNVGFLDDLSLTQINNSPLIDELIIWTRALSVADRNQIHSYFETEFIEKIAI